MARIWGGAGAGRLPEVLPAGGWRELREVADVHRGDGDLHFVVRQEKSLGCQNHIAVQGGIGGGGATAAASLGPEFGGHEHQGPSDRDDT